jgi:hypothetical protein
VGVVWEEMSGRLFQEPHLRKLLGRKECRNKCKTENIDTLKTKDRRRRRRSGRKKKSRRR